MRISHEAVYQALYIQGRGALKRELVACLRTGRALRVPRARTAGRGKKFVTEEVRISQRLGRGGGPGGPRPLGGRPCDTKLHEFEWSDRLERQLMKL